MAGLDNTDAELDVLYEFNDFAGRLPGWAARTASFLGETGLPLALVLLIVLAWFLVRRRPDAPTAVAGVLWAGPAAAVTWLVNMPIRDFVARPRPFVDHPDLEPLVDGKTGYSFVSDHAGIAMAIAVALFLVHRTLGLVAFALALCQGLARVLLAVHYPTDVIGGFALGTASALLFAPPAMAVLPPLVRAGARTRWLGWIARPQAPAGAAGEAGAAGAAGEDGAGQRPSGRPEPRPSADPGLAA
ncbi:phosphatase PAP2 family protein [Streptomyces hoynatensis]|uniref:Phosphatase PAP2 family protein n=1 Tax=Streptomyces hoynatensis TaxID=1141874 RepID=A0A3A9Z131_9ACTN|nr:phosphatase PAP2 family protein [Streptomyces hoynatensis]RKN41840.1 phosphatase PAP2 family protein [Streptomyces hoynatensis]